MKKLKEFWNSLDGYTVVRKRGVFLFMLNVFLLGMNLGVLISPRKNVNVGCNNSAALTPGEYETDDESEDEEA